MNVNCRESDYKDSTLTAIVMKGDEVLLLALNPLHSHGKFTLSSQQQCWILLELLDGPEDPSTNCQVPIVNAPLPKVSPRNDQSKEKGEVCKEGLGDRACAAAGGAWVRDLFGSAYCKCK